MPRFCGSCGIEHLSTARFCGGCGAATSSQAPVTAVGGTGRDVLDHWTGAGSVLVDGSAVPPWELGHSPSPREPSRRRPRGRSVAVLAAAALTAGMAGAAVYASTVLGGGGAQPEDVLPSGAIGFVKLDLDPSAGQKVAALRLAQKFPDIGVTDEGALQDQLLRRLFAEDPDALDDYEQHISPWLGQRAGVALMAPTASAPDEPAVVVAVQVSDPERATAGLEGLAEQAAEDGDELAWGLTEEQDYVLIGEDTALVDAALRASTHLVDDERFLAGVDALDGDHIAVGWVDVEAAWRAVPEEDRADALDEQPGLSPEGLFVVGASVGDDHVDVVGETIGLSIGDAPELQALIDTPVGRASGGLISSLPADSIGAFSVTGLGEGLATLYSTSDALLEDDVDVDALADQFGLRLPDDLSALFGEELAAGLGGEPAAGSPRVDVHVRTDDGARGAELLLQARDHVADEGGDASGFDVQAVAGGYTATLSTAGPSNGGTLGDEELFRRTLPDVDRSGMSLYFDIDRVVEQADLADGGSSDDLSDEARRNIAPLQAIGCTAVARDGGDSSFRFRMTVG